MVNVGGMESGSFWTLNIGPSQLNNRMEIKMIFRLKDFINWILLRELVEQLWYALHDPLRTQIKYAGYHFLKVLCPIQFDRIPYHQYQLIHHQ